MTYHFSTISRMRLEGCDQRLQAVCERVLETIDCSIIDGHRPKERQDEAFRTNKSEVKWPDSKHNSTPSMAVDCAPYPIDWNDRERATLFAGFMMATALAIALARGERWRLRWGGDWDTDWKVNDNHFDDLWHFEIVEGTL